LAAAEYPPKKIAALLAAVGPSQAIVGNAYITGAVSANNPNGSTVALVPDASRTWLLCDLDGRNMGTDVSNTWAMVALATGSVQNKNGYPYQPVHSTGTYLGRNYAFLDGHAEYLLENDWPDAVYQYP
jgi:prepilin-type processing-associated H-X9-DG protein